MSVHPTAIISPNAEIGSNVRVGPYAVIEEDVRIGEGCEIASHVVVKQFTTLGRRNRVSEHAVLGGLPQDVKFSGEKSWLVIGDDNLIREGATLHRASGAGESTSVGSRNFLMIGVHIAHNCVIGDDNTFANEVALAGHITVEDNVFLSNGVGCHQYVRLGRYAMVGGKSKIVQDVLPFFVTDGNPASTRGVNSVGLRRGGFKSEDRLLLRRAYRTLLSPGGGPLAARLRELELMDNEHVQHLVAFVKGSQRGFIKARKAETAVTDGTAEII